ncbi:hypothetical protein KIH27_00875 [Mycobacterium sp. M1]|uniref:Uncharacterized protein n=2 Tax=Mycolicibacter acidiphilus TaxID=2835306 RepID=A0ABS5RCY1_9MYCO|nr:hypothetical protein [Mycolicibacter acidiphilus]
MRGAAARIGAALVVAAFGVVAGQASALADPDASETAETPAATEAPTATETPTSSPSTAGGHQVTYTITATSELNVDVQYIQTDPPSKAAYNSDADKYLATSRRTPINPGSPLVYTATLADPSQWALVTASGGLRINPELHCAIAIDGEEVVSVQGGSGVTCSTRPW